MAGKKEVRRLCYDLSGPVTSIFLLCGMQLHFPASPVSSRGSRSDEVDRMAL
jgi:hypothetical protein